MMIDKKLYYNMIDKGFNSIIELMDSFSDNITEQEGSISISTNAGEYVFNRQPASFQLWSSSPLTGPSRFKIKDNLWIHEKKNIPLEKYLQLELKDLKYLQLELKDLKY